MTMMLSPGFIKFRYTTAMACIIKTDELDYFDESLIGSTAVLQDAFNEGEMPIEVMLNRLMDKMDRYIQKIDGDISVLDIIVIAESLKIDPEIVSSYILDLGLEIKK